MRAVAWSGLIAVAAALFSLFVVQSMIAMNRPLDALALRRVATMYIPIPSRQELSALPTIENFEARDHSLLDYRHYRSAKLGQIKLYLVHAETRDELQFATLATAIAGRLGLADVFTFDMRGHGQNPLHRGDVGYVGQPTDDLQDLIAATSSPGDLVIIGGHSAGAAVAMRLAAAPGKTKLAGLLLLSPVLSPEFVPARSDAAVWAVPLSWRVAGLKIENALGLHWSDHEIAVQYAVPEAVWNGSLGYAVTSDYTWRSVKSLTMPNADGSDLAQVKVPAATIIGSDDEVIDRPNLEAVLKRFNKSEDYAVLKGETHFGLVNSEQTLAIIQNWLSKLR